VIRIAEVTCSDYILACDAVKPGTSLHILRRKLLPQSSGLKNELREVADSSLFFTSVAVGMATGYGLDEGSEFKPR
jgi:hypothetical protein